MSNNSTAQQRQFSDNALQDETYENDLEGLGLPNLTPAEVFIQSLAGLVNQNDVETIIRAQKQMLQRFEKTNEMLLNCNALSQSRFKGASDDFKRHVKVLTEMKKDLDYIFRKIRIIKQKLSQQYPVAYTEAQPQRSSLAEEAEDDGELACGITLPEALPTTSTAITTTEKKDPVTLPAVDESHKEATITSSNTTVEYVQMEEAVENGKPIENELIKRVCSIETTNPNDSSDCTSEDTG